MRMIPVPGRFLTDLDGDVAGVEFPDERRPPLELPAGLEEIEQVGSNLEHTVDGDVVERLKRGAYFAGYAAWDWYGNVWFADGKFHVLVWRHRSPIALYEAADLVDALRAACDEHGDG